jgi:hypothetical protein
MISREEFIKNFKENIVNRLYGADLNLQHAIDELAKEHKEEELIKEHNRCCFCDKIKDGDYYERLIPGW